MSLIMKEAIKISVWAFLVFSAAIIQTNHILEFWGVNPNLILLFVFLSLILEKEFSRVLLLIFTTLVLTLIFLPYWPKEILILAGLALLGLFLRKFLTGRELWDFVILILLGSLGFYLINNFSYCFREPLTLIIELFYNIALGILLILILNFLRLTKKQ